MFPERLKIARKKAGLSLRALAEKLEGEVSAQAIGKYERGEMMPSSRVLIGLSKALEEPVGYFMSAMGARLENVDFRKKSGTSVKERARVEAAVLDHVERYLMIEEILDLDSASWDRPFKEKATVSELEEVDDLAASLRGKWKLGKDAIPDMTELLEEHGIKVFVLPLPKSVSGLTCLISRPGGGAHVPVIVVNAEHGLERRRLTLAHELAHRLIDSDSPVKLEKAANRFAGAFLIPGEHLLNEIGRHRNCLGYRELIQLKHLYRVSAAALLVRLEQLGVISNSTLIHAFQTVAKGWRKEEPEPLEEEDVETAKRFERLCYRALVEDLIALPKAAELLRKPAKKIQEEIRGPASDAYHCQ